MFVRQVLNRNNLFKLLKLFLLILFSTSTIYYHDVCFAMDSINNNIKSDLYIYSGFKLSRFLKKIGYPDLSIKQLYNVQRNSTGTALRFVDWRKRRGVVVTCEGLIKEFAVPGGAGWFNDENQAIAWYDALEGKVYYQNGTIESPPFHAVYGADPSGSYFMKSIKIANDNGEQHGIGIFSIERPNIPLVIKVILGDRIFYKDDKVYFFGRNYNDRDIQIKLFIYQEKGDTLIEIDRVIIKRPHKSPAPFSVEDLNPSSGEVFILDYYDMPFRSVLYVFNLEKRELKKISKEPIGGGRGFYLRCDIIDNVLKRLR